MCGFSADLLLAPATGRRGFIKEPKQLALLRRRGLPMPLFWISYKAQKADCAKKEHTVQLPAGILEALATVCVLGGGEQQAAAISEPEALLIKRLAK